MDNEMIKKLIKDQKTNFKRFKVPAGSDCMEEGVDIPIYFFDHKELSGEFVTDYLYDCMENFFKEDEDENNWKYHWQPKDIIPIAALGTYTLYDDDADEEKIPDDSDEHQFYGILFLNNKGEIFDWHEGFIESLNDLNKIGTIEDFIKSLSDT